jgi:hypothetical protein
MSHSNEMSVLDYGIGPKCEEIPPEWFQFKSIDHALRRMEDDTINITELDKERIEKLSSLLKGYKPDCFNPWSNVYDDDSYLLTLFRQAILDCETFHIFKAEDNWDTLLKVGWLSLILGSIANCPPKLRSKIFGKEIRLLREIMHCYLDK